MIWIIVEERRIFKQHSIFFNRLGSFCSAGHFWGWMTVSLRWLRLRPTKYLPELSFSVTVRFIFSVCKLVIPDLLHPPKYSTTPLFFSFEQTVRRYGPLQNCSGECPAYSFSPNRLRRWRGIRLDMQLNDWHCSNEEALWMQATWSPQEHKEQGTGGGLCSQSISLSEWKHYKVLKS